MATLTSQLCLKRIELSVFLGWPSTERQQKQSVFANIDIFFSQAPVACQTDELTDTICYAALIQELQNYLQEKSFHLLEHLTYEIYLFIKKYSPAINCCVHITKYPNISSLLGGVCFSYGDQLAS